MIYVKRPPAPRIFQSSQWRKAQDVANKFFRRPHDERAQHHFAFTFYKHPEVREALEALFHAKCAFCETNYSAVSPMDVENFRPKGGAIGKDGKLSPDHYWWLAYEWFNLYPACAECNRSKGSRFPVDGERAPIGASEEEVRKEKALLLDPCVDYPEAELVFADDGKIASNTIRGRRTIETFNLNRSALVERRRIQAASLRVVWGGVIDRISRRKIKNQDLDREVKLLQEYLSPRCEFLALTRSCLQQWSIEFCKSHLVFVPVFEDLLNARTGFTPEPELDARRNSVRTLLRFRSSTKEARPKDVKTQVTQTVRDFEAHEAVQAAYSLKDESAREKFFAKTQYIKSIEIKNFRVIRHIKLAFTDTVDAGSWLLILGENATGKSSVLQAVALALMGEAERERLRLNDGRRYATYPTKKGEVVEGFVEIQLSGGGEPIRLDFKSNSPRIRTNTPDTKVLLLGYSATRLLATPESPTTIGSDFSKTDNLFNPFLALTRASHWLYSLDQPEPFNGVVASLKRLMMLKEQDHFEKTKDGRIALTALGGRTVFLEDLSAGYQSVVALATDIMSVLLRIWESIQIAEGIVLIDEIDAHLHPRWKMQIVERLRETFPRVQFLVTSHEPLSLRGLNQQEVAVMTRSSRGRVAAITEDLPNPKALRVDQLLTSEFFGLSCTLSPELEIAFNEYYALLAKRTRTKKQDARLAELKTTLAGLRLMGDTPRERMMYEVIDEFLAQKAKSSVDVDKLETKTRRTLLKMWQEV